MSKYTEDQVELFTYENEDEIDPELICSHICMQPLTNPVVHKGCQNSFCFSCIKATNYKCPICNTGSEENFTFLDARLVLNMLARLKVKCTKCASIMARGEFQDHKFKCSYPCTWGCGEVVNPERAREHERTCLNFKINCTANDIGCKDMIPRCYLAQHIASCRWEQSRWIVEPLYQKISEQENKLKKQQSTIDILESQIDAIASQISQHQALAKYTPLFDIMNVKGLLASAAADFTIRIWDIDSSTCVKILNGHTDYIFSLIQIDKNKIASASDDGTIRIWNIIKGECIEILEGHDHGTLCITNISKGCLASGGRDCLVKLWHLQDSTFEVLQGHEGTVMAILQTKSGTLVSADENGDIRLWDNNYQCLGLLKYHNDSIYTLLELNGRIISSGADGKIVTWNEETREIITTIEAEESLPTAALLQNNFIVTGDTKGTMTLWSVDTGTYFTLEFNGHNYGEISAITRLKNNKIVFSTKDWSIRIYDYETGNIESTLNGHYGTVYSIIELDDLNL
jgi:hypothetical protein